MRVRLPVAGRLPLVAQRPAHPDIIISQGPIAKCPIGSGRLSLLDGYALHRAMREHKVKYGGVRALPGREAVAGPRLGTPEGAEAQLRVSEGMISYQSRVREIRTLGSTSGERNRVQGGE